MASGTIKGKFTATAASNVYPEIRWRSTKNIASNNSSITAELWFIKVSSYWYPFNYNGYSASISINGNSASANRTFDLQNKSSQMVWSRTITVAHNADGKKSITISSGGSVGLSNLGSVSVSGTAVLDTIPRASSIGTISGNQIGSAITIPISRASGTSFTHDVSLKLGSKTVSTTGAGTSATLTPNLADFSGQLTSTTSGSATITVITKSGNTVIGTKTKSHTIYVPDSVKPSISGISSSETVADVSNLGLGAKYVQNKSGVKVNATGNGIYGSTIKSLSITYNKQTLNGSGSIFSIGNVSGNQTITIATTDSRGRTGTATHVITVLPYSPPKIPEFKVWRDGTTNKVKASLECSINTFLKADGKTSTGGVWYIDANIGGVWGNKNSGQLNATTPSYKNTNISIAGDYDETKSFSFRVNLSDAFGHGATATANISTAKTLMDFNKDEGIGIGKMHENGALDVGGDTHIKGNLFIDGTASRLKGTLNWTVPNANATGVFTHLYRNNGKMLSALYHATGDDALAVNMYDQNGNYKIHRFMPDGRVNFGNRLWVDGYISSVGNIVAGGAMYENGDKRVHADWTPPELYSGAIFMDKDQRVYPTKKLSQCRNGWALYWSDYTWETGKTNDFDWNITYIHKSALTAKGFNGFHSVVGQANSKPAIVKYMYLRDDHLLGNIHNTSTSDLKNVVLRKVYEF